MKSFSLVNQPRGGMHMTNALAARAFWRTEPARRVVPGV